MFTHKRLDNFSAFVCMLIVIRLGLEGNFTLCTVKFYIVLYTLSTFLHFSTWLLCMVLSIVKIYKLVVAYLTGVVGSIHEVVFDMVSKGRFACKFFST